MSSNREMAEGIVGQYRAEIDAGNEAACFPNIDSAERASARAAQAASRLIDRITAALDAKDAEAKVPDVRRRVRIVGHAECWDAWFHCWAGTSGRGSMIVEDNYGKVHSVEIGSKNIEFLAASRERGGKA